MSVEFFIGRWDVRREIVDRRASSSGAFVGVADFVISVDGGADWIENGELSWADHHVNAGRRLRLQPRHDGGIDVLFDDGRYFHAIEGNGRAASFVHDCTPDRYEGTLVVTSRNTFVVSWDVAGPAKSTTITSTYERAAPGA